MSAAPLCRQVGCGRMGRTDGWCDEHWRDQRCYTCEHFNRSGLFGDNPHDEHGRCNWKPPLEVVGPFWINHGMAPIHQDAGKRCAVWTAQEIKF